MLQGRVVSTSGAPSAAHPRQQLLDELDAGRVLALGATIRDMESHVSSLQERLSRTEAASSLSHGPVAFPPSDFASPILLQQEDDLRRATANLRAVEAENSELRAKVHSLAQMISEKESSTVEIETKCRHAKQQLAELEAQRTFECEAMKRQLASVQEENRELQARFEHVRSQLSRREVDLATSSDETERRMRLLEAQLDAQRAEIVRLTYRNAETSRNLDELGRLRKQLPQMELQTEETTRHNQELQRVLMRKDEERVHESQVHLRQVADLQAQIETLKRENQTSREQRAATQGQSAGFLNDRSDSRLECEQLTKDLAMARDQLRAAQSESDRLRQEVAVLRVQYESVQKIDRESEARKVELDKLKHEAEQLRGSVASLEEQNRQLTATAVHKEQEAAHDLQVYVDEVEKLQKEISDAAALKEALEATATENAKLKKELQLRRGQGDSSALSASVAKNAALEREVEQLREKLIGMTANAIQAERMYGDQVEDLQRQLNGAKSQEGQLRQVQLASHAHLMLQSRELQIENERLRALIQLSQSQVPMHQSQTPLPAAAPRASTVTLPVDTPSAAPTPMDLPPAMASMRVPSVANLPQAVSFSRTPLHHQATPADSPPLANFTDLSSATATPAIRSPPPALLSSPTLAPNPTEAWRARLNRASSLSSPLVVAAQPLHVTVPEALQHREAPRVDNPFATIRRESSEEGRGKGTVPAPMSSVLATVPSAPSSFNVPSRGTVDFTTALMARTAAVTAGTNTSPATPRQQSTSSAEDPSPFFGPEIVYGDVGASSIRFFTIQKLFFDAVQQFPDAVAAKIERRVSADGSIECSEVTWRQYFTKSMQFAKSLVSYALPTFACVAYIGYSSFDGVFSNMGSILAGCIVVNFSPLTPIQLLTRWLEECMAQVVVIESTRLNTKLFAACKNLRHVKCVVCAKELPPHDIIEDFGRHAYTIDSFLEHGVHVSDRELQARIDEIVPNAAACITYTAGTSGDAKAVLLSHDNVQFAAASLAQSFVLTRGSSVQHVATGALSDIHTLVTDVFLPLYTVATTKQPFVTFFPKADCGVVGACVDGSALVGVFRFFRPTVVLASLAIFQELWSVVKSNERVLAASDQKLRVWATNVMREASLARQSASGGSAAPQPKGLQLAQSMADKVLSALGLEHVALFVCIGGPAPTPMMDELAGVGIDVHEVFSAAETTGVCTASSENRFSFGTCGVRAQGTQIQIDSRDSAREGEICFKGRHVMMGYLRHLLTGGDKHLFSTGVDPSGWLRLGDVGYFNESAFLCVTGRVRDILTTSSGDRIQPQAIERHAKRICPALSGVVVIGDKRRFLVCLLTLKCLRNRETGNPTDELAADALAVNPETLTVSAARKDEKWLKYVATVIAEINGQAPAPSHKIKRFCILPADFSASSGEMTVTGKVRRHVVAAKYSTLIEKLYADENSVTPRK